jgi:hypothetical protein
MKTSLSFFLNINHETKLTFQCISKPQTGVLAGLAGASEACGGSEATDPLTMWLAGGLNLTDEGQPVDPLKWWMQQRRAGNTHGGLLEMALDVLSCPGKSFLYVILIFLPVY